MNSYSLAFDVGGLFIKAAVLNRHGQICADTVTIYPAKANETKEVLLQHFVQLIHHQIGKIIDKSFHVTGIGFAFPGPFDYENGICYIQGAKKYDQLYAVNIRAELLQRLREQTRVTAKIAPDFQIVFENDASLFALGELHAGKVKQLNKAICITIGTGAGSAFIDGEKLIKHRDDVPENGWIYNSPFRNSIVDDYISKRGIIRLAEQLGMSLPLEVKDIAELARSGDAAAIQVFQRFGETLGEVLLPFVRRFSPDGVVIGGQIAKSGDLFREALKEVLQDDTSIELSEDTNTSTFIGVSKLLQYDGNGRSSLIEIQSEKK